MKGAFFQIIMAIRTLPALGFNIPSAWIFEKILQLEENLTGQDVTLRSVFNPADKRPSMKLFLKDNDYRFKDFSSGNYGDGIELYRLMVGISREEAKIQLQDIWNNKKNIHIDYKFVKPIKEVTAYETRNWNDIDVSYWKRRKAASAELEFFNIKPIKNYTLCITRDNTKTIRVFDEPLMYGYFTKTGELYKIYKPANKAAKFIEVFSYTQGEDQLTYKKPCLIIMSSLKDIVGMTKLKFSFAEYVAADSENIILSKEKINYYKSKYKYVSVLFDNDSAGLKAMNQYKEVYGIQGIFFNVEKDVDECIVQHGLNNTRLFLTPILKKHYESLRSN